MTECKFDMAAICEMAVQIADLASSLTLREQEAAIELSKMYISYRDTKRQLEENAEYERTCPDYSEHGGQHGLECFVCHPWALREAK